MNTKLIQLEAVVILLLFIAFLLTYGGHRMNKLETDNKTLKAANDKLIRDAGYRFSPGSIDGRKKPDEFILCGSLRPGAEGKQDYDFYGARFFNADGKEISAKEYAAENDAHQHHP